MNNDGVLHFENNEPLPKKFETTYLGNEINKDANTKHEILYKMQEIRKTWYKLCRTGRQQMQTSSGSC